jgi:hypothetical protein
METRSNRLRYQYPENLKRDANKSYISFETYVETPLTINGIIRRSVSKKKLKEGGDEEGQRDLLGAIKSVTNKAVDIRDKATDAFIGRGDTKDLDIGITSGGKFTDIESENARTTGNQVDLYMPISITFPDGATYENSDLGIVGAIGESALQSGKSVAGTLGETVLGGAKTLISGLTGGQGGAVGSVMVTELLKNKGGKFSKPLSDNVSLSSRVISDPNTRVLFKGVAFREFSFQFKLIASTFEEAQNIEGMIKFFRSELYPEEIVSSSIGGRQVSIGMRYPNRFKIRMKYGQGDVLNKIKPAYLRAVNTVYNGTQQSFHQSRNNEKAKPFEVDLTLSFQESLKLTREDIEEGF